jgi:hypothetical protein
VRDEGGSSIAKGQALTFDRMYKSEGKCLKRRSVVPLSNIVLNCARVAKVFSATPSFIRKVELVSANTLTLRQRARNKQ